MSPSTVAAVAACPSCLATPASSAVAHSSTLVNATTRLSELLTMARRPSDCPDHPVLPRHRFRKRHLGRPRFGLSFRDGEDLLLYVCLGSLVRRAPRRTEVNYLFGLELNYQTPHAVV